MAEENEFLNAVVRMRHFLKEYFKTKDKKALKNAKHWEKRVDHLANEKLNAPTLFA